MVAHNGQLIVSGGFYPFGGCPDEHLLAWNGSNWSSIGSGTNGGATAFGAYDGKLAVAGWFSLAGGKIASRLTRWTKSTPTAVTNTKLPENSTAQLFQNSPNPFNPTTTIRYTVPRASRVTLRIYTPAGQLVRTLVDATLSPGVKHATWDGTNNKGNPVASGVYVYRLQAGKESLSKKMTLLK